MTKMGASKIAATAALVASVFMSSAAGAAPAASSQALAMQGDSNVQVVRDWRGGGWRGHRGHHRGGNGWGWGAAAATGLLLGAPLAYGYGYGDDDEGYEDGYSYRSQYVDGGVERCEATFRSFDPRTGTYMGYDGVRHTCPYL